MQFPTISEISRTTVPITEFRGYNHNLKINAGEWYDLENVTCDRYPMLCTRKKRRSDGTMSNILGAYYGSFASYVWCDTSTTPRVVRVVVNGVDITDDLKTAGVTLGIKEKTMVQMGAYLVIWPDAVYINTSNVSDSGYINAKEYAENISVFPCSGDGEAIEYKYTQASEPTSPSSGEYWLDTSETTPCLKVYSAAQQMWTPVASTYVQLTTGEVLMDDGDLNDGDGIKYTLDSSQYIQFFDIDDHTSEIGTWDGKTGSTKKVKAIMKEIKDLLNATHVTTVTRNSDNTYTMVIPGIIRYSFYAQCGDVEDGLIMSRIAPDMDYVTVAQNRIWGCYYDGTVNELYCCKLGDCKNWSVYNGISTDAWASSVGTPGAWTGAITYNGRPTFFKDNAMFKVYISSTGAHQVVEEEVRGVAEGSSKSLCIVDSTLFWLSTDGVMAYSGSVPSCISSAFGGVKYKNGVAGAKGQKMFLAANDGTDNTFLVFDTDKTMWTKEDSPGRVTIMGNTAGNLFCTAETQNAATWNGVLEPHPNSTTDTLIYPPVDDKFYLFSACDTLVVDNIRTCGVADFAAHIGETYLCRTSAVYYEWVYDSGAYYWKKIEDYTGALLYELDPDEPDEDDFDWMVSSGRMGTDYIGRKYINRLNLKMQLDAGASMTVWFMYDSSGEWVNQGTVKGAGDTTFVLPIRPRRCDHFYFKLTGKGGMKLYAISKIWEIGSDFQ